jgi:hypothetical protein
LSVVSSDKAALEEGLTAAEQQVTELQSQTTTVQECQNILAADKAFTEAGHGKILDRLAQAVSKGHLKPNSFIAQRLSSYGGNLCKTDTRGWRFSDEELAFFSLMSKTSRSSLELLRGPVGATLCNFLVAEAAINDLVPIRQAIQNWDAKLAISACIKPLGFDERPVKRTASTAPTTGPPQHCCIAMDATDTDPCVSPPTKISSRCGMVSMTFSPTQAYKTGLRCMCRINSW